MIFNTNEQHNEKTSDVPLFGNGKIRIFKFATLLLANNYCGALNYMLHFSPILFALCEQEFFHVGV